MELFLKTPPTGEPVTVEEVRIYLRLSPDEEDSLLLSLIAAARTHVERLTGRALLKQQWQMELRPPYPRSSPLVRRREDQIIIHLLKPPLLGIQSVQTQEKDIPFIKQEGKILLSTRFMEEEIRITYWAGYGETSTVLPADLKLSVLMAVECLYERRELNLPLLEGFKVFGVG